MVLEIFKKQTGAYHTLCHACLKAGVRVLCFQTGMGGAGNETLVPPSGLINHQANVPPALKKSDLSVIKPSPFGQTQR
ncbi:hypothetical protein [Neisseria canis]|uniref:hypothetical protein n=1 Tax=Neisseria canis TaxID=493 RepID=UPI000A193FC2|nr:hypothetical protein [Neisseria canis]OSI13474.1 hypothetical protein BWD07_00815 [Neisseria canis]